MKVVQINSTCGSGSTGKICVAIGELLTEAGVDNYILYAVGNSSHSSGKRYMSPWEIKMQAVKARIFGNYGFQSQKATKRLIRELEQIAPDIVHLHNLHSHNVHLEMLFSWLKKKKIKIFWTFHDCWAFTGYCPHYDMIGCDRWKTGCHNCPQKSCFSWFFDRSGCLYNKKKSLFSELDLTIITPSQWLADQVKQSFLSEYEVKVINNGIDLSIFCPRESDFRKKYDVEDKFIVLGVANIWCKQKGLDVFIELSKKLDKRFQIVLVGTDDKVDKQLPRNVVSIHRTQNQEELAEIYTAADVFVNPTREENFPTTHMESLACGTPIIAFNTGGCSETIDETCGIVVEKNDVDGVERSIRKIYEDHSIYVCRCVEKAAKYCDEQKFMEYIKLYN